MARRRESVLPTPVYCAWTAVRLVSLKWRFAILYAIIDFLPFAYGIGLIVMLFNRKARRLGDYAAGTMVVKERSEIRLDSLLEASTHGDAV